MLARSEFQTVILFRAPLWLAAVGAGTLLSFKPAAAEEKKSLPPILSIAATAARTHSFSEFLAAVREAEQEKDEMAVAAPPSLAKALTTNVVTVREYRFGKSTIRQMMVGPNDPHFEQWQNQANARLKAEIDAGLQAESAAPQRTMPATTAVICEAGCADESGSAVYSAADAAAKTAATTLPSTEAASAAVQPATSAVTLNGAFECLAGCYNPTAPAPAGLNLAQGTPRSALPAADRQASAASISQLAQNAPQDSIDARILHLPPRTASVTRP